MSARLSRAWRAIRITIWLALAVSLMAWALSPRAAHADTATDLATARALLRNCQLQSRFATTATQRAAANACAATQGRVIAGLSATPAPSPSGTAPSPSPTGAPPGGVVNCMPLPSRSGCGWPDATNTGARFPGPPQVRVGKVTLLAGQALTGVDVHGCVQIMGPGVVIRDVRIVATPGCSYASIDLEDSVTTGALIEDVEIDMSGLADTADFTGRLNQRAITGDDFTARRVWWHGGADCAHYGSRVVIEDSFCDIALIPADYPKDASGDDPHIDGLQSAGGSDVVIRHNTIRNPNGQTSAIINGTTPGVSAPQYGVRIVDNLLGGGGWTVYCNAHYAAVVPTIELRGNRIARGAQYGPLTGCETVPGVETTVWDDTGLPLAPAQLVHEGGPEMEMDWNTTPGLEGAIGPLPGQYGQPHVYARDVHSGAGNCVCGGGLGDRRHVQAAPGVDVPEWARY